MSKTMCLIMVVNSWCWMEYRMREKEHRSMIKVTTVMKSWRLKAVKVCTCERTQEN